MDLQRRSRALVVDISSSAPRHTQHAHIPAFISYQCCLSTVNPVGMVVGPTPSKSALPRFMPTVGTWASTAPLACPPFMTPETSPRPDCSTMSCNKRKRRTIELIDLVRVSGWLSRGTSKRSYEHKINSSTQCSYCHQNTTQFPPRIDG